jgi:hypothetical protein
MTDRLAWSSSKLRKLRTGSVRSTNTPQFAGIPSFVKFQRFPGNGLVTGGKIRFDARASNRASSQNGVLVRYGKWSGSGIEGQLRELLLSSESPLCRPRLRGVRNLSPGPPGRVASPSSVAVRLPAGAPAAGRLGVPDSQRAGRAARLGLACRRPVLYVSRYVLAALRWVRRLRAVLRVHGMGHGHIPPRRRQALTLTPAQRAARAILSPACRSRRGR